MTWQDTTITIAVIALSYALIPQIIKNYKAKKPLVSIQTAIITFIASITISITYLTLDLTLSSIMNFIVALLWAIILAQSIIYKNQ
ncbi:MAG TPA: hypothetical protein ENH20_00720 [Candidatus Pacearchaeota archaeon]|nr:hypothetical protein [Candidatus Pacearchaeota archaeon]